MRRLWSKALRFRNAFLQLTAAALGLLLAAPAFAQGASPLENAVSVLQQAFTSTIARGLSHPANHSLFCRQIFALPCFSCLRCSACGHFELRGFGI